MPTSTPNMSLLVPIIGTDSGLTWEQSVNTNSSTLDEHNHSPGQGNQIPPSGLNINSTLSFNNQVLSGLQAAQFTSQASSALTKALYVIGSDLFYNDGASNVIQVTLGGSLNATTSGISSGTATASFVSSVLVVNADVNKPANIQCGSILIGNNTTSSHFVTVQPTNALATDYSLTLPPLPASQKIMTLDASGNMTAPYTVDGSTITIAANVIGVPAGAIGTTQLANNSVTQGKLATGLSFATVHEFGASGAGTYSYTIPTGVSVIWIEAIGGGGGGGGGGRSTPGSQGGQGGSGGIPVFGSFAVTAGQVVTIVIGAGGTGGTGAFTPGANGGNGNIGNSSSVSISGLGLVLVVAGQPGGFGSNNGGPNVSAWGITGAQCAGGSGGSIGPTSSYNAGGSPVPNLSTGGGGGGAGAFTTTQIASNGGSSASGSGLSTGGAGYGAGGGGGEMGTNTGSNFGGGGGAGARGFVRIITVTT